MSVFPFFWGLKVGEMALTGVAVTAGLFEEVGRYVGYRFFMRREPKTWSKAVMFGLGHEGLDRAGGWWRAYTHASHYCYPLCHQYHQPVSRPETSCPPSVRGHQCPTNLAPLAGLLGAILEFPAAGDAFGHRVA